MELIIGKPVLSTKSNLIVIQARYMHGDADAYTEQRHEYKIVLDEPIPENFFNDYTMLKFMQTDSTFPTYGSASEQKRSLLNAFGETKIDRFADRFLEYDCTDQSYDHLAQLERVELFYYDQNGVKFELTVQED
jgi:hypothetical protein